MKKWALFVDVAKCEDCNNCFLACKDEFVGNDWPGYSLAQPVHGQRWMNIMRTERGQYPLIDVAYRPTPCMHCADAPCIRVAKDGAVYKRDDGIVIIDPVKAVGQRQIMGACPYGAVWWNQEKDIPQKCTFCAHLLDQGWDKPRCVQACPTGALRAIKMEDSELERLVAAEKLERLHAEYNASPRVYYQNLHRFDRCFLGGSLAFEHDGVVDCAQGAEISLFRETEYLVTVETDLFGDFKFDGLAKGSGPYRLEIRFRDHKPKVVEADLDQSFNLGTILF